MGGSVGEIIISALARFPDRAAFVADGRTITYREVEVGISRVMQWFRSKGLKKGDTVVQMVNNSPEQWIVTAAIYLGGLRSVNLHTKGSAEDHTFIIADCDAVAVIVDPAFADRVATFRPRCPNVSLWYCHGRGTGLPSLWDEAERFAAERVVAAGGWEDTVRLAYTGGTTGRPKGVMLSNRSNVTNVLLTLAESGWPENIRLLCVTPISHGAGNLIIPTLFRGGTVYLHRDFDKERFLQTIERERITVTFCVPTILYVLLDDERTREADLSSLRLLLYGAAPMSPVRIKEALDAFGPILCQRYGQTEAPSSIASLRPVDHERSELLASCGRPFPGTDVAILDENDRPVVQGETGEICVRGPIVMSGYWKQPEQTAQVCRNGWLHTGDLGRMDEKGFLFIVDRKKDMIISGGFNVYPREVEDVLAAAPGISSVAVLGQPDPKWGEAVVAFVELRAGAEFDAEALRRHVRERKGPINTPKTIHHLEKMPVTSLGKPDKKALRERLRGGSEAG